ncbi:phage protein Gp36 family protein, partial [Streptomyces scabiei]|uniref:phage protein Gp36 family protein n=1 Tax=Streptomyces scabiei TaxID=1930 RepID=UPI0038F77C8C
RLCCDIARYFLGTDNAPEHITERYQNASKFLVAVGKGTLSLGVDELGANAQTDDTAVMQSAGSVFARGKSKGFI